MTLFRVRDYDLGATLDSGQAFRWNQSGDSWEGVVESRWVALRQVPEGVLAQTAVAVSDWKWLAHYLQTDVRLEEIRQTFPQDDPMRAAVAACGGLRLLRQPVWECLASFILSTTKQIPQIRQVTAAVCERFGDPIPSGKRGCPAYAFPSPDRLAEASEGALRGCRMGFRAPYLRDTARAVTGGQIDLLAIQHLPLEEARAELMRLPGVGRKVADCVLLFGYGFAGAFPVDVWITKALREFYFPRRRVDTRKLHGFAVSYFGPNAGYAQQYLFHYMRRNRAAFDRRLPQAV